jgi:hypothetical protein
LQILPPRRAIFLINDRRALSTATKFFLRRKEAIAKEVTVSDRRFISEIPRALVATMIAVLGIAATAQADPVTYNFTGTLNAAFGGSNTVIGQFTLDAEAASITAFNFTTPTGVIDPTHYDALVVTDITLNPAGDLVALAFQHKMFAFADHLLLDFQTTLASFDGSKFSTAVLDIPGGNTASHMLCIASDLSTCHVPRFSFDPLFTSGAASVAAPSATPEPASMLLLGSGLVAFGVRRRQWRHKG